MTRPEVFQIELRFRGDLVVFVKSKTDAGDIARQLNEPTSVKDAIESCGVPHPEVNRILVNGEAVDFGFVLRAPASVEVFPVEFSDDIDVGETLQRRDLHRFVADGHLGKLVRNLRLLGVDVSYQTQMEDRALLDVMHSEKRALLTRDRRLLMHAIVRDGYCPRSSEPNRQTIEVLRRFNLANRLSPFTRCLHCNGLVKSVEKSAIIDQLEPLTRIYYDEFRSCTDCGKIFWRGSHFSKLESLLEGIRNKR
ncbi:MAG: Mut7-C RNAse domain-containing protein [Chthoniobacterales bacterium]